MKTKNFTLPLIYLAIVGICSLGFVFQSGNLVVSGFYFSAPGLLIPIIIDQVFTLNLNWSPIQAFFFSIPLSLITYIPLGFLINKLASHKSKLANILIYLSAFPTVILISWLLAAPFITG